jgi:hypothetical protein
MKKRADDKKNELLMWFKQDFIYNENDWYEEVQVNI